jgi:hypothetical protein
MKFWCLQISQTDHQILNRFLPYEARAEICQKIDWLFGRFEDNKKFILRLTDVPLALTFKKLDIIYERSLFVKDV